MNDPSTPALIPPPLTNADLTDLDRLGEEIATLSGQIQAATYKLLVLIFEFDEAGGWNTGFKSCAHWLCWRIGLDPGTAREKVRVARALNELPLISASMSRGEISYAKVRALTRVATSDNEEELLTFARCSTGAHVERLVRTWRRIDRSLEEAEAQLRHASRSLTTFVDEDGMLVLRARLEPEVGAVVEKALEAAGEVLYPKGKAEPEGEIVPIGQRRADALVHVAESALAGGLDPGSSGDRYQVVVHTVEERLRAGASEAAKKTGDASGTKEIEKATRDVLRGAPDVDIGLEAVAGVEWIGVSAETSRRLACDAAKTTMKHTPDGTTLDAGRKTRTIPPSVRRALRHRDGGCRFPGCNSRYCDAHHVRHWADGGETKLSNLVLLCHRHHRAVHEEGFRVEMRAIGEAVFHRPNGQLLEGVPAPPEVGARAIEDLIDRLEGARAEGYGDASMPIWDGGPIDLEAALDLLWRPREAAGTAFDRRLGDGQPP